MATYIQVQIKQAHIPRAHAHLPRRAAEVKSQLLCWIDHGYQHHSQKKKKSILGKRQSSAVKKCEFKQLSEIEEESDGYSTTLQDRQGKTLYFHG